MEKKSNGMKLNLKPKRSWGSAFAKNEKEGNEKIEVEETEKPKMIIRLLDKLAVLSIIMLFLGVPLFFTNLTYQGIVFEKQLYFYLWLFVGLIAWTIKGIILGEMKIKKTALDIPLLIFWVVYLLSTIFSVDKWHSLWGFFGDPSRGFISITALIIAYYLIRSYFTITRLKIFMGALIFSGGVSALWALINILNIHIFSDKIYQIIPVSLIGSISALGVFLSMLIPIIVVAIFKVKDSQRISQYLKIGTLIVLGIDLALIILTLILSFSLTPWVGLLIGIGFLLVFLVSRIVETKSNLTWLPMTIFVIVFAFLMIGNINPVLQFFKINVAQLPVDISPDTKMSYEISKGAIKDNFIFGSGPATYGYAFSKYKPQEFNLNQFYNLRFYQGKGIFFEYASTIGVLGLIGFLILILSYISMAVYSLTKNKERNKLYSLGLFSSIVILFVDTLLYRLEGGVLILGALIATLTLAIIFRESASEEGYLKLSLKASPKYALALAFIFMVICAGVTFAFVFLGKVYLADLYAGQAIREPKISEDGSIAKMKKAIELYPKEARYFSRIGQEYMVLANQEVLKDDQNKDINLVRGYINSAIQYAEEGKQLTPKDVSAVETVAQIYENTGYFVADSLTKAQDNYNQALALEPHNPIYFLKLGQIKLGALSGEKDQTKRTQILEEANTILEKSVAEKANYDQGYYNLALVKEALKDVDGAVSAMETAFKLNPQILDYHSGLAQLYTERGKGADYQNAEMIFLDIQKTMPSDVSNNLNLGFLYEKMKKNDEAITQYKKILSSLPDSATDAKDKVNKMINNLQNGIPNTPENLQSQTNNSANSSTDNSGTAVPSSSQNNPTSPTTGNTANQ